MQWALSREQVIPNKKDRSLPGVITKFMSQMAWA